MRIWITGAAGFVGRRLAAALGSAGHTVIGVDREVEITDAPAVAKSLASARADAIVHLAAMSSQADALREPTPAARVNYWGTRAVLEAARSEAPDARVLLVTSGAVYGNSAVGAPPFRECDPLDPPTPYAWSKACADLLGARYAERGLDVVRVRPFNHTGPGQSRDFVLPAFARQVAAIAAGRSAPADVYNVASGIGRRIGDLLDALIELAGTKCQIEIDPARVRPTDTAVGDASRLRDVTGWTPRVPWIDTMRRLLTAAA